VVILHQGGNANRNWWLGSDEEGKTGEIGWQNGICPVLKARKEQLVKLLDRKDGQGKKIKKKEQSWFLL
jgi:hypothetical protein